MGRGAVWLMFLLLPLSTGCSGLFRIGTRNLLYEARLVRDSRMERFCFARLAEKAWKDIRRSCPQQNDSTDYACGFKAGFVDYLYAGGNVEPPAFVPKRYLTFHEQKTHGCQGLMDWYAGFRHGAAVAQESGIRQSYLIALPLPPGSPPMAPPVAFIPGPVLEDSKQPDRTPLLPMPRPQPSEAAKETKPTARRATVPPDSQGPDLPSVEEEQEKADPLRTDVPDPEVQP